MSNLFNLDYESTILSGIINFPDMYSEISFLTYKDFGKINSPIWQIIENTITNKGSPTPVILAEKLKSIGITLDGLENYDYLESLRIRPIDKKGIVAVAKELKKLTLVRTTYERAVKLQHEVVKLKDSPAKDILKCIDDNLGKSLITLGGNDNEAVNIYERLPDYIEELGNNPVEERGLVLPFPKWQEMWGGIRDNSLSILVARSGAGKSTILTNLATMISDCNKDKDISVLYLDTEMVIEDQLLRIAAAKVGCPFYLLDTGLWRKSEEFFPKVRKALNEIRNNPNKKIYFKQVGSMGIQDLSSFVRNWYYSKVGRGNKALIIYDYLKILSSDRVGSKEPEYQLALSKCQALKDMADDLGVPIFTAVQANRSGIVTGKQASEIDDSENSASLSDRIMWLAHFVALLRRKTPEEIVSDGPDFGTHMIKKWKGRTQGKFSSGHHDLVRVVEKINGKDIIKYKENYLNFNVDNFLVEERGSFSDMAELKGLTKIKLKENKQDGLL